MIISLRTFTRDLTLTHDSSRLWRYRQRVCIPFGKTPPSKNKMAARSVTKKKSSGAEVPTPFCCCFIRIRKRSWRNI